MVIYIFQTIKQTFVNHKETPPIKKMSHPQLILYRSFCFALLMPVNGRTCHVVRHLTSTKHENSLNAAYIFRLAAATTATKNSFATRLSF